MIQIGEKLPDVELKIMGKERPESVQTHELFQGKRVVLFALPGAFTPTCSKFHLPDYVELSDQIRDKGIDLIICLSVNDAWVMDAWGNAHGAGERVMMLADGNAEFTRAIGLDSDMSGAGFGIRSLRYSIVVNDSVVTHLNIEEPRKFEVSDAKSMLALLQ